MERGRAKRWSERTALLGIIAIFMKNHANSVNNSFNKTKYGSARNFFMKQNFGGLKAAFATLANETALTHVFPNRQVIEDTLGDYAEQNPNAIYRIYKAGEPVMMLTGNWDDADDPAAVKYNLIAISADASKGLVSINGSVFAPSASLLVSAGNSATISAQAQEGYVFDKWSDGNINPQRTIVVNAETTLTAQFKNQAPQVTCSALKSVGGSAGIEAKSIVLKVNGEEVLAGVESGTLSVEKGSSCTILMETSGASAAGDIKINDEIVKSGTEADDPVSYTFTPSANFTLEVLVVGGF